MREFIGARALPGGFVEFVGRSLPTSDAVHCVVPRDRVLGVDAGFGGVGGAVVRLEPSRIVEVDATLDAVVAVLQEAWSPARRSGPPLPAFAVPTPTGPAPTGPAPTGPVPTPTPTPTISPELGAALDAFWYAVHGGPAPSSAERALFRRFVATLSRRSAEES